MNKNKLIKRASFISIIGNILLTIIKLVIGIIGNSLALISDAIHSLSDCLSTFVVLIGLKISQKKEDHEHPYGHERYESVSSIILSIMLLFTGGGIGLAGINNLLNDKFVIPSKITLIAAFISIVVKELMFWQTYLIAKKIKSTALKADAWHHRSDALSSIGSFIGILGTIMGIKWLDSFASIIISLIIIKVSISIFIESINSLVDKACDEEFENEIRKIVMQNKNVIKIDVLKTRIFASKVYIDMEISLPKKISFVKSHSIAEEIHNLLEKEFPEIKHCMIHVNPF